MSPLGLFGVNRRVPRQMLFQWESDDRSLTPRTAGGAGTLTRGSIGSVYDEAGVMAIVANNAPRFGYVGGSHGLLLEGSRQNIVTQSGDITAANGWTVTGLTATPGAFVSG